MIAKKEISLLPEAENPNSLSSRLVNWLTSVGRVVIIVTELIVVAAFVSRFWLDRKNSDISEVIRQQKAILESTKAFENDFNMLQQKLTFIKTSYTSRVKYTEKIATLVESTPSDIIYDNLAISRDNDSKVVGNAKLTAFREESIVDFVSNLLLNPDIQSVDIKSIEKKPKENKYEIDLFLVFNTAKKT